MLRAVLVGVHSHRLHRLRRLAHHTFHALLHALLDLLRRRRRLPTHLIRVRHIHFINVTVVGLRVDINLVLPILFDEVGEILDGTRAGVVDGVGFGPGGEKLNGWKALDLVGDVVESCVYFGDGDLLGKCWVGGVEGG